MNKTTLALAAAALSAAFTGAVQAQSSVAIYGRVDLGVREAPTNLGTSEDKALTLSDSSTGRIGFRGEEDLGGGLSAYFQLEHRFTADTGSVNSTTNFWQDKAWVGLASKTLGRVQLGRQSSPIDNLGVNGRFEAFGGDSLASMGGRTARAAAKWDNSIYYTTPTLAGFSAGLAAAPGETATRRNATGAHLDFAQGKLLLATSYQIEQDAVFTAARNLMRTASLAGAYDFGLFRPSFTLARSESLGLSDQGEQTVATMGLRVPVGLGEFRASFRYQDDDLLNGTNLAADRDSHRIGLGYQHLLSKRTSVNLSLVNEQVKTPTNTGRNEGSGWEVALRHNF